MTSYSAKYYRDFNPLPTNPHMYANEVVKNNKKDDKKLEAPKVAERSSKLQRHHSK